MVRELARPYKGLGFESGMGMDICVVCMFVCVSVFVCSEHTGTYVLIKSVEYKVPTALAYDVARSPVGFQLRCRPRHLTAVQNYEAFMNTSRTHTQWGSLAWKPSPLPFVKLKAASVGINNNTTTPPLTSFTSFY